MHSDTEAKNGDIPGVIHRAGIPITVNRRWVRQRCSWCGEILISRDLLQSKDLDVGKFRPDSWVQVFNGLSRCVAPPTANIPNGSCLLRDTMEKLPASETGEAG